MSIKYRVIDTGNHFEVERQYMWCLWKWVYSFPSLPAAIAWLDSLEKEWTRAVVHERVVPGRYA